MFGKLQSLSLTKNLSTTKSKYFKLLSEILEQNGLFNKPDFIFNMNETL